MKDQSLRSVVKHVEILEGNIHDHASEADQMKKELTDKQKELDELKEQSLCLQEKLRKRQKTKTNTNDLEQYSQRNNIRIYGIPSDSEKQSSQETTYCCVAHTRKNCQS